MQLILLLALLLSRGGSSDEFYNELKPILESLGGDDIKNVLKGAEEFKDMFASFGGSAGGNGPQGGSGQKDGTYAANNATACNGGDMYSADASRYASPCGDGKDSAPPVPPFAMAPVAHIADREIIYRLAQYFSDGAAAG